MPQLARKRKVAVPDRRQRLITFSHGGNAGFDYGSSDHTYATIFTVNRFSKDFSSGRMWWSRKGPRICWGRRVFCLSHLRFAAAVRGSLGISRGLCRWLLD